MKKEGFEKCFYRNLSGGIVDDLLIYKFKEF